MCTAQQLYTFIRGLQNPDIFIEAEGRQSSLINFFDRYNRQYAPTINNNTDGIISLDDTANKWGVELRLYLHAAPPFINSTRNTAYRTEYQYRINDNDLIWGLFNLGYRIGLNP